MNIYKISQNINNGWDTYDSAIVCAESEEDARKIHPSKYVTHERDGIWYGTFSGGKDIGKEYEHENCGSTWVRNTNLDKIKVEFIGKANENIKRGLILGSFNAG